MWAPPVSDPVYTSPYPVNLDLADRPVLVVGGGPVAARKAAGLLRAGGRVTVVAPSAVTELAEDPDVRWHRRSYRRGEVASYRLAITATNDPAVNAQVARDGDAANVFVNAADDPENCTFILPAVVERGDIQVAISTNGRSPAVASWLRRQLERTLTEHHAELLDVVSSVRDEARRHFGTSEVSGWVEALDADLVSLIAGGRADAARSIVRSAIGLPDPTLLPASTATSQESS